MVVVPCISHSWHFVIRHKNESYLHQLLQHLSPGRNGSANSRVLGPEMLAHYALSLTKCFLEYVSYDILARIKTTLLNKLVRMTRRAHNVGYSGDEVVSRLTFLGIISDIRNRLIAPSNSLEFRAAYSEVDLERHATIQRIQSRVEM
jgi:hypothetical protein